MKRCAIAMALLLAACSSSDSTAARPGRLSLLLSGGATEPGAIVLVLSGAPVDGVEPAAGNDLATNVDGSGTHIMMTGAIHGGVIASFSVPDVGRASAYVVTVEQVADGESFALLDPASYHVTVGAAP